jgi:anti-sigma factor RsiW
MTAYSDFDKLDAYLNGDLPFDDVAGFKSHMKSCAECMEAIDEQRWIDGLLHSPARLHLEHPPAAILDSVRLLLAHRRHRILPAACGLAAAAALLIATGWFALTGQGRSPTSAERRDIAVVQPTRAPAPVQPQAIFVTTSEAIAVSLESPSSDVTIVQVYPTTDTERRWRLKAALSTNL